MSLTEHGNITQFTIALKSVYCIIYHCVYTTQLDILVFQYLYTRWGEWELHPSRGGSLIKHLRETHPICVWFFHLTSNPPVNSMAFVDRRCSPAVARDRTGMCVRMTYVAAWKETKKRRLMEHHGLQSRDRGRPCKSPPWQLHCTSLFLTQLSHNV